MSIYDTYPTHPAVRREQENDRRRAEAIMNRVKIPRQRTAKGTSYRHTVEVPGGWFHFTKGPRRGRQPS